MRLIEILMVLSAAIVQNGDLAHDGQALASRHNATHAALGASLAAMAYNTHDNWHEELQSEWYINHPSQVTDVYGSSSFNLPAAISLWTAGTLTGQASLQRLGNGLTRTLILTQLVVGPIKLVVHRRRPDASDRFSFPSGHAANVFALARYVQRDFGTTASLLPYGLALTTAVGRMEGGRHYLSDVIMGASFGLIVGSTVHLPRSSPAEEQRLQVLPMTNPATGLRLVFPFR